MIRIFKDNDVKVVTNGVYKSLYAPLGYKLVIEEKKPRVVVQEPVNTKPENEDKPKESSKAKRKRGD